MFEHPWAFLLLGLAVPWILWSRRRAPGRLPVGGLEPFRSFAGRGGARRRLPLSLLLALAALAAGTVAVANPRTESLPPVVIEDRSFSAFGVRLRATSFEEVDEDLPRAFRRAERQDVGDQRTVVREPELFEAIRLVGGGRRILVVTDRPEPQGLPDQVSWHRLGGPTADLADRNAAILNAWQEDGTWQVHWAAWGALPPLRLMRAAKEERTQVAVLDGTGGVVRVDDGSRGDLLFLDGRDGVALRDAQRNDETWLLTTVATFVLPEGADPRWAAAVDAAWPGSQTSVTVPEGAVLGSVFLVDFDDRGDESTFVFDGDPFTTMPELEAVAEIADRITSQRVVMAAGMPRPRAECEPPGEPVEWQGELPAPVAYRSSAWSWALAGLGLYLASLLALRLGH